MQLDALVGNAGVVGALHTALAANRLSHGILLTAPDGCGRGFAARCLAADYLYPNGGPGAEAVLRRESPELLIVEGEGKSGQIPVDKVRAVRRDIFHSSLSAAGRVVWIRDAHRMAAPSANALLKVLEEPPSGAIFILTAYDAAALPATVVSRCTLFPLAPVTQELCEKALQHALPQSADPTLPALLAALYGGRIGLGLRALQEAERLAIVHDALSLAKAAGAGDMYTLLRIFTAYEGRAEGDRERREALLADTSDALAAALRGTAAPGLPAITNTVAARLLAPLQQTRLDLRANAAPKLAFSALAIHLNNAYNME